MAASSWDESSFRRKRSAGVSSHRATVAAKCPSSDPGREYMASSDSSMARLFFCRCFIRQLLATIV